MVPASLVPPVGSATDHTTPVLLVPATFTVNCCDAPTVRVGAVGDIVMLIAVILALPDFFESSVEVATIEASPAAVGVSTPPDVIVPALDGLTDHDTELL